MGSGALILLLMAFIYNSKKNRVATYLCNQFEASVLSIASDDYAKLMGADSDDFAQYDDYYYYILRLEQVGNKQSPIFKELHSVDAFGQRVNYLSNLISQDLSLITGKDTIKCALAHWERTYNIRKDITISLAFKKGDNGRPRKLIWNDQLFTGIPIKFKLH